MGIRLYPNTKDATVLERLAGVPEGTMRLLQLREEMEKSYRTSKGLGKYDEYDQEGNEVGYDLYCLFQGTPVEQLDNFLISGWGTFDYRSLPAEMQEECFGELPVGVLAARLLLSSSGAMPHWDLQDALEIVEKSGGVNWG